MLQNFLTVGQQVLILFILMAVGFLCGKIGFLNDTVAKKITDILLYIVAPCIIIRSFIREYDPSMLLSLLYIFIATIAVHILSIVITKAVFRSKDESRQCVLRFGAIFSNCSFMSLPLLQQILGNDGVLYGATFVAVFNLITWSYGIVLMSGDKTLLSPRKILLNPAIICVFVGLVIFIYSIPIPTILYQPISYLADLNTPLPMLVIGFYLSQADLKSAFTDKMAYLSVLFRILIIPIICLFGLYFCGIRGTILTALVVSISAPTAAMTTMFSAKFNRDTALSVKLVALSTLFSIVTMPLMVALTQQLPN